MDAKNPDHMNTSSNFNNIQKAGSRTKHVQRDGANDSLWQTNAEAAANHSAAIPEIFDTLVVGAGITGLTTA